jgi:hypothetical protein
MNRHFFTLNQQPYVETSTHQHTTPLVEIKKAINNDSKTSSFEKNKRRMREKQRRVKWKNVLNVGMLK